MSKNPTKKPNKKTPKKSKWQIYTEKKREIERMPLTPAQYEARVLALASELGV